MKIPDPYAELGPASGASDVEVKRACRRLVSHWHPAPRPRARPEKPALVGADSGTCRIEFEIQRLQKSEDDVSTNATKTSRAMASPRSGRSSPSTGRSNSTKIPIRWCRPF